MVQPNNGARRTCLAMKTKWLLLLICQVAILSACSVQEMDSRSETGDRYRLIHAFLADGGKDGSATRLQIAEDGKQYWNPGDRIITWKPGENEASVYEATCTTPSEVTEFESDNALPYFMPFALYPGNIDAYLDNQDGVVDYLFDMILRLDAEQTSFESTNLMVGYCEDEEHLNYYFRNICSGLKFTLSEPGVKVVSIKGNDNEDIAGLFSFDMIPDPLEQGIVNIPQVTEFVDGEKVVTLTSDDPDGFPVGEWLYLHTLPTVFEQGITITLTYVNGNQKKVELNNRLEFKRNVWKKAANLDARAQEVTVAERLNREDLPLSITPVYDATTITITIQANTVSNLAWSSDGENWSTSFDSRKSHVNGYGVYVSTTYTLVRDAGSTVFLRANGSSLHGGPNADSGSIKVDKDFYCSGNIMSLLYATSFATEKELRPNSNFSHLFASNTTMLSAPLLPATKLSEQCYSGLFYGCTSLKTAPELPAETLEPSCYHGMFSGCTQLEEIPALPADRVYASSYQYMFKNCTSLKEASIPATLVDARGCEEMFSGCTSLEKVVMGAKTTVTIDYPFRHMFQGCTSLSYIYCPLYNFGGSTNHTNSASYYTYQWVDGVAENGVFVRYPDAVWTTGKNGIPAGWEVQVMDVN